MTRILLVTGWGCIPTYCLICRYDIYDILFVYIFFKFTHHIFVRLSPFFGTSGTMKVYIRDP